MTTSYMKTNKSGVVHWLNLMVIGQLNSDKHEVYFVVMVEYTEMFISKGTSFGFAIYYWCQIEDVVD